MSVAVHILHNACEYIVQLFVTRNACERGRLGVVITIVHKAHTQLDK